jgi:hypothetical protein
MIRYLVIGYKRKKKTQIELIMRGRATITINGKLYNAVSGLPVATSDTPTRPVASKPKPHKAFSDIGPAVSVTKPAHTVNHTPARAVHRTIQKSQTLRREILKQPKAAPAATRRKPEAGHVPRSDMISKFAPHPQKREATVTTQQKAAVVSPKVVTTQPETPKKSLSSRERKEKLIAERLASIDHHKRETKAPRGKLFSLKRRTPSVVAACFALVLLGGYLTYLNMPNLSVRVAAAQSGVAASFPQFKPDGYHFNGPISYAPGEVTINFAANGGPQKFTIKQKASSWDSQAVLDNYVAKKADNQYITSSESGLTIYTFDNKAAWVNRGIFYTIDGDAPLSSDQVLRIAASM